MASKKALPDPKKDENPGEAMFKVNKWDGSAVKNAMDDAIKDILKTELTCEENFGLMDGRLVLCGLAVGVALYALLWDYLYPFPQSRLVLIICVSSYFVLMAILTVYTTFKEKGIFVVVKQTTGSGNKMWEASSYMKKYDDKYQFILSVRDSKSSNMREASFNKSVANFIDTEGVIVHNILENEVMKLYYSLSNEKKDK